MSQDAYERDREANAVGDDYWPEEWIEDEALDAQQIAANKEAKRQCERAIFVNGGLRNFLTVRRG